MKTWTAFALAIFIAGLSLVSLPVLVSANTGCPESTDAFGTQSSSGDCTITVNTIWGNGTYTKTGNINVNSGVKLTLWSMVIKLNPASDNQYRFYLTGGKLEVHGGQLTSNTAYVWNLNTDTASGVQVRIYTTNVSLAGKGTTPGLNIAGGTGHRIENATFSNSAKSSGANAGVIVLNGANVNDVLIYSNIFSNTGHVYSSVSSASSASVVFKLNNVTSFDSSGTDNKVLQISKTQVLNNVFWNLPVSVTAIYTSGGGGPGWPGGTPAYRFSANTIRYSTQTSGTENRAIDVAGGTGYKVDNNTVYKGRVRVAGTGSVYTHNNLTYWDEALSSIKHSTEFDGGSHYVALNQWWEVTTATQAVLLTYNANNITVVKNKIGFRVNGNNAMGIETYGSDNITVAWNTVYILSIAASTNSAPFDNEYEKGLQLHNNTAFNLASSKSTECIEMGGVRFGSKIADNTCYGNPGYSYGIYDYIYTTAGTIIERNWIANSGYAAIFQTGANVVRDNTFNNVTSAGPWLCPNSSCAGSSALTKDNEFYNNKITYGGTNKNQSRMSVTNFLDNTWVGHGGGRWRDGTTQHIFYGKFLFFAKSTITSLAWANQAGGDSWLTLAAYGKSFTDKYVGYGATDTATVTVAGSIDRVGSSNAWDQKNMSALYGLSVTSVTLQIQGSGSMGFTFSGLSPSYNYNVGIWKFSTSAWENTTFTTTGSGAGSFTKDFTSSRYNFTVARGSPTGGGSSVRYLVLDSPTCSATEIASDTGCWSDSSGGAGGQTVPDGTKDVYFDANSGSGTATLDTNLAVKSLTMSGFVGTLAVGVYRLSVAADLTRNTGTISIGDSTTYGLVVGGSTTLSGSASISCGVMACDAVFVGAFTISDESGYVDLGSGTWAFTGDVSSASTSLSSDAGTGVVLLNKTASQFIGGTGSKNLFPLVILTGGSKFFTADFTTQDFYSNNSARVVTITAGVTWTIGSGKDIIGHAGSALTIRSSSGIWYLNATGADNTTAAHYVDVQYSDGSQGASIDAADGTNIDSGSNSNWWFPPGEVPPGDTGGIPPITPPELPAISIPAIDALSLVLGIVVGAVSMIMIRRRRNA